MLQDLQILRNLFMKWQREMLFGICGLTLYWKTAIVICQYTLQFEAATGSSDYPV